MPWRTEYHQDQMIVEVSYWGDTSAADIHDATIEAISLVSEHKATRGLVNCLNQTSTASIVDLYELPKLYEDEGLSRSVSIAFVEPSSHDLHAQAEFYENVCVNRGWHLRSFGTRERAVDWLAST